MIGLDGNRAGDGGVDDSRGMAHDAAAFHVAKDVHHRADRPLHHRRSRRRDQPQSRPDHLAPARVAPRPALHAPEVPHHFTRLVRSN